MRRPLRQSRPIPRAHRRTPPRRGPRMDDIFFGDGPPIVSSVILLPRTLRLTVAVADDTAQELRITRAQIPALADAVSSAEAPESVEEHRITENIEDVTVTLPAVATVPEPLQTAPLLPEDVWSELNTLLAEEDERADRLAFRAEMLRRETRASLNTDVRPTPPAFAGAIHERTRTSARRFSPRPRKEIVAPTYRAPARAVKAHTERRQWALADIRASVASPSSDIVPSSFRSVAISRIRVPALPLSEEFSSPLVAPPVPWREVRRARARVQRTRVAALPWNVRLREAFRIGVVAIGAGMLIGTIDSLGTIPRLARLLASTAQEGVHHLTAGFKAVAVADVAASNEELTAASTLFQRAEDDLRSSTSLTVRLLGMLDPKQRYTSGRNLLEAGEKLSELGKQTAALVALFQRNGVSTDGLLGETTGGIASSASPSPAASAPDLTRSIEDALPLLQTMNAGLGDVEGLLADVRSDVLPAEQQPTLETLRGGIRGLHGLVTGFLKSHDVILELLGARHDRQYLFLFQNNRELRPTGGFIGSFALVDVSRGRVSKVHVDSIYNPDGQLHDFLVPPRPLQKITDRWFTRDANWFADYPRSARKVATLFERSGGPTVDGVIAITPTVLEKLLRVTGPIEMPDYGVTVTADNVLDETQRLVTFEYDRERNTPKAFLADLLPELLQRVLTLPQERWGDLTSVLSDTLREKHVLVFLKQAEAQAKVAELGWGGTIDATDGDYLMRVEANVGGHKTDELMEQSVDYDVTVEADGTATATLVTTRHHGGSREGRPGWKPEEDWYRLPNVIYERVLVPKGSVLLEARGFATEEQIPSPYVNTADYDTFIRDPEVSALEDESQRHDSGTMIGEEEGKASFGNWVLTQPGETVVTVYRYRLPFTFEVRSPLASMFRYSLLAQSQPGHRPVEMQATLRVPPGYHVAWGGPDGSVSIQERAAVFTTHLVRDQAWGAVAERQ